MKIGLVSSMVPLVQGGYRFIVEWLKDELVARGHQVDIVYIPNTDDPHNLTSQFAAFRMIELDTHFDLVVTFRPPAHMVRHRRKVVWFIHHIRPFYDLWDTPYRAVDDTIPGRAIRDAVIEADTVALKEAHAVFTNSETVSARLRRFNDLGSEVLYPPLRDPQKFRAGGYGDEIVSICRCVPHKRQHLLVEALGHTNTPVKLRLCGEALDGEYFQTIREIAERHEVGDRLSIEANWISEERKVELLESALASAYLPLDEDSYGYPTLEAAHARKATITCTDSGGVLEFVRDEREGLITAPDPREIAGALDRLYLDRTTAERFGGGANLRVAELAINWDHVIDRLLA